MIKTNSSKFSRDLSKIEKQVDKKIDEAVLETARRGKDLEKEHLLRNGSIQTQKLYNSINYTIKNKRKAIIGPMMKEAYPQYIEKGRGPVYPKHTKALRFTINGKTVFAKSVGPAKARPFVHPTWVELRTEYPYIMEKKINEALK